MYLDMLFLVLLSSYQQVLFFFHLILVNLLGLPLMQCNQSNKSNPLKIFDIRMIIFYLLCSYNICIYGCKNCLCRYVKSSWAWAKRSAETYLYFRWSFRSAYVLLISRGCRRYKFACYVECWQENLVYTFSLCAFSSHFVLIASRIC